jgi:hypothetical protein
VLGPGVRRVLVIAISVGNPDSIGSTVARTTAFNPASQNAAKQALVDANNQPVDSINQFTSTAKNCTNVAGLEQADQALTRNWAPS